MIGMMEMLLDCTRGRTVDVHPFVKIVLHVRNQQRDRKEHHPGKGGPEILKYPAHGSAPTGVGNVVKQSPKHPANRESQEEIKREQPRVSVSPLDLGWTEEKKIQTDD